MNSDQKKIVDLLIEVDEICKQNGIKYSLHGGTLLGAERNGRFIPWDDDADISMLRSEFLKLKRCCGESNTSLYVDWSDLAPWLVNICKDNEDGAKITIDVFVWDYIASSKVKQLCKITILRLLQGMMKNEIEYNNYTRAQKILVWVTHVFGQLFSIRFKRKMYYRVSTKMLTGDKKHIHRANDAYVGLSYIFDSEYMKDYTCIKFEDKELMVTTRYKEFLKRNYGEDYMIPPDKDKRKQVHGHDKEFLPETERGGLFSVRR